jgi:hypothetical protein
LRICKEMFSRAAPKGPLFALGYGAHCIRAYSTMHMRTSYF